MKKLLLLLTFLAGLTPNAFASGDLESALKPCIDQELGGRTRPPVQRVSIVETLEFEGDQYFYVLAEEKRAPWGFYVELSGSSCKLLASEFVGPISAIESLPEPAAIAWIKRRFLKMIKEDGLEALRPEFAQYQQNLSKLEKQVAKELGLL